MSALSRLTLRCEDGRAAGSYLFANAATKARWAASEVMMLSAFFDGMVKKDQFEIPHPPGVPYGHYNAFITLVDLHKDYWNGHMSEVVQNRVHDVEREFGGDLTL